MPGFQNSSYGSSPLGKQKASKLRKLKENRTGLAKLSKPSCVWNTSNTWWRKHRSAWVKTEIMRQAWGPGICRGQWTWGSRLPALKRQDLQLLRLLFRFAEHLSMSSISDGRSGWASPRDGTGLHNALPGGERQGTLALLKRPGERRVGEKTYWKENRREVKSKANLIYYSSTDSDCLSGAGLTFSI